jgi:transcriptional regulator of acetoin/glycerol metabolism
MNDPWLAHVRADPTGRARSVARVHATFLADGTLAGQGLRDVVAQSWLRSAHAHVNPDADPPVTLADGDLAAYRTAHPLTAVIDVLRDLVGGSATDGEHLMAVADAAGRLLWVEGHHGARKRAEAMNFVEGAMWDEEHAGTNAPGTALALGQPVQIFSTEHFRHRVQGWTCAAAPITDRTTGQVVGVIDVTGGDPVAHPHSLALVKAAARVAGAELGWRRDPRSGIWAPVSGEPDRLELLGRGDGLLRQDGRDIRLNRRQAEVLFVLSEHPLGVTGEQLADALYEDFTGPAAVRVELTRLRRAVGELVASRPYRLARPMTADYHDVSAALRRGDTAAALAAYPGPLLPSSEAPAVVAHRRWLETQLRSAVLASGSPDVLSRWAERFGFDDLQVWERLTAALPAGSARRAGAAAHTRDLRVEYGLSADVAFT